MANDLLPSDAQIPEGSRIHHLRHTFASLLLNAGESLDFVAQWLGNQPDTTRKHYAEVQAEALRTSLGKLMETSSDLRVLFGPERGPKNGPKVAPKPRKPVQSMSKHSHARDERNN